MEWLLGKTLTELQEIAVQMGMPAYTARQMARWLYDKRVTQIEAMTDLSKEARERLSRQYEMGGFAPSQTQISTDGTQKFLFPTLHVPNSGIECVVIPDKDRATLCVSSQVGCQMGCAFCMTARMGFQSHLTAGEIIAQFLRVPQSESLTNVVYMGMGEPLNNWEAVRKTLEIFTADWGLGWSPKRITVSTVGIIPVMEKLLQTTQVHVAVSLHNPFDAERATLMPAQKAFPISSVVRFLQGYDFSGQRRLSFEYILFDGWNDTPRHANALLKLLRGLTFRINLIRFHAIPDFPLRPASEQAVEAFKERLNRGGIVTTVRASRGMDILAACGLLSDRHKGASGVTSQDIFQEAPKEFTPTSAYKPLQTRIEALCSRSEHCTCDIRRKLEATSLTQEEQTRLLAHLEQEGFVDNTRYAKAFVRDKSRLQGWGRMKVAAALRIKQLPEPLIQEALQELDQEAQQNRLEKCLQQKAAQCQQDSPEKRRAKLIRFALGRGYTYAEVMDYITKHKEIL